MYINKIAIFAYIAPINFNFFQVGGFRVEKNVATKIFGPRTNKYININTFIFTYIS